MTAPLVPVLVLVVLPTLYLGQRLGLWRSRTARRLGIVVLGAAVVASLPYQGVDFVYLKRLDLFLAAALAGLLLLRRRDVAWARDARRFDTALAALTTLAVLTYVNFFAFHGARTFVHLHDVAHYYLGSKYYAELGYHDLYVGMLRAEAELHENRFRAVEARDLDTQRVVHIRELLERSAPVKGAFTPERWTAFQQDVELFRRRLGPQYGQVLLDHGFNPSPLWAWIGTTLANRVPAGSDRGVLLLTLLDPLLLAAGFGTVAWAFGARTAALALAYFCVIFGASFGWTGGAFLRQLWFFGVVAGACCLQRGRSKTAGALFALATLLRVFPVFFVLPLAAKALATARRRGDAAAPWRWRPARRHGAFFGSYLLCGALLFAATGLLPRGFQHWEEFGARIWTHAQAVAPNVVGLTDALAHLPGAEETNDDELERRQRLRTAVLLLGFLPALGVAALLARRLTDLGALALGIPLVYVGLGLAAYYYAFLVLLVLWRRRAPEHLALCFAVEAAVYGLLLFHPEDARLHVYRGLLVALLCVALFLDPLRRELRRLRRGGRAPAVLAGVLAVATLACTAERESPTRTPGADLVVISLDTTRADYLGCYGRRDARTPVLDALGDRGVLFRDVSTAAPTTLASHTSIMTGLHPQSHGVPENGWIVGEVNVLLAEILKQAGYRTAGVAGSFALSARFGIDQGFDSWDERFDELLHPKQRDQNQRRAAAVTDAALEAVDAAVAAGDAKRAGPLFLFVHYFDPHAPYDPPTAFRSRPDAEPPDLDALRARVASLQAGAGSASAPGLRVVFEGLTADLIRNARGSATREDLRFGALYRDEIAYVDFQVGRLLEGLGDRGLLEQALVLVVGDHGETLWEHGDFYNHGLALYQTTLQVPLIVRLPGDRLAGRVIDEPVSTVDLLPTLLSLLDLEAPAHLDGVSLHRLMEWDGRGMAPFTRGPVYSEATQPSSPRFDPRDASWRNLSRARSVRLGPWKLVHTPYLGSSRAVRPRRRPGRTPQPAGGRRARLDGCPRGRCAPARAPRRLGGCGEPAALAAEPPPPGRRARAAPGPRLPVRAPAGARRARRPLRIVEPHDASSCRKRLVASAGGRPPRALRTRRRARSAGAPGCRGRDGSAAPGAAPPSGR